MWTTSKREREEKESLKALHYHHKHKNIDVYIGGEVAQALLTVQSTRTYHTHYLMDFVYDYQLHWMTVNLLERIWVGKEKEQTWLHHQTPDSLTQTKELGVYTEKKDSIGVTSFA